MKYGNYEDCSKYSGTFLITLWWSVLVACGWQHFHCHTVDIWFNSRVTLLKCMVFQCLWSLFQSEIYRKEDAMFFCMNISPSLALSKSSRQTFTRVFSALRTLNQLRTWPIFQPKCHNMTLWRSQPHPQVLWRPDSSLYVPYFSFSELECHQLSSRNFMVEDYLQLIDDHFWTG